MLISWNWSNGFFKNYSYKMKMQLLAILSRYQHHSRVYIVYKKKGISSSWYIKCKHATNIILACSIVVCLVISASEQTKANFTNYYIKMSCNASIFFSITYDSTNFYFILAWVLHTSEYSNYLTVSLTVYKSLFGMDNLNWLIFPFKSSNSVQFDKLQQIMPK